jgi:predicted acetyltransferase
VPKYLKIKYFKNLQTISIIVVVDDIDGVFKNPPDTCNSLSILNNKTSIHIDLTAMGFFYQQCFTVDSMFFHIYISPKNAKLKKLIKTYISNLRSKYLKTK